MEIEKLIIIGSGPAAYTAAIYAARANLQPVLYEGLMAGGVAAGGQLTTTTEIENFPGFPDGIGGGELMKRIRNQALRYGTTIVTKTVDKVDLSKKTFSIWVGSEEKLGYSLILATGATAKRLGIAGEKDFWQKGISACAVCDGALPFFRDKPISVIGGGDTACEEALFLAKYGSQVFLIHRRDQLRASKVMQERLFKNKKISIIWNHILEKALGEKTLTHLQIKSTEDASTRRIAVNGLFYAIGHTPNSSFLEKQVEVDDMGYVVTQPGSTMTSQKGVFAAGDLQDKKYRQAITAAGSGCQAFFESQAYLDSLGVAD